MRFSSLESTLLEAVRPDATMTCLLRDWRTWTTTLERRLDKPCQGEVRFLHPLPSRYSVNGNESHG